MWKAFFWLLGVALLIVLIQYPVMKDKLIWKTIPTPLAGKTIVIDPGHGGRDGGAKGQDNTEEKVIALDVSKRLRDYLEQAGAVVYLTREEDKDLAGEKFIGRRKAADIRNRLAFIHEKDADFFVSIHLNSLPSSRWSGAQTFYYDRFPENKHLATMIQAEIIRNLQNTTRKPLEKRDMYLLKHAEIPGALVEIGFLSNDVELQLLKDKQYQEKMAVSIYQGMIRYIMEEKEEK
ncbi:MAG TPA: N-acetylmuramoyl-L-alanine amidase CwlD [Pseudogracilibacillus sp.]|nr:N-acetylmuramoyl-L-alanine amidase CwlD [Pseudogracilibacillus sp.]